MAVLGIYIDDSISFFRKLTLAKVVNIIGLYVTFYKAKWTGALRSSHLPMTLSIEPTTACNLRCPECPSGLRSFSRDTGNLKIDFFRKLIDDVKSHLVYLIFYFQGEPFINPDFLEMVTYASQKNIYTITSTNGHFLSDEIAKKTIESGLDRLIISIDGATQEVYQQYRVEGHLDQVLQGAKNAVKWKKRLKSSTPHIIFQCLVVRPNEHQLGDINELAKEIGVDEVKFKTAQVYDYEDGNPLIPRSEKYSRYKKNSKGKYELKYTLKNECWKLWHAAVVTWNGNVVPCCFDKDAAHQMGDLKDQSFRSIWQNEAYQSFRNRVFNNRSSVDICTNCTEGCQVWH